MSESEDRIKELADEVQRLSMENIALTREQKRLRAQLADRGDVSELRVTRAMVRGIRDDVRIIRDQLAIIFEDLVTDDGERQH